MLGVLHQAPESYGLEQTRWTLSALLRSCPWLRLTSESGLSQLLLRLGIRRKRARHYLHSPDPDYGAKVAYLQACWQRVQSDPARRVFLYLDEFAFERQPRLACAYETQGHHQALARLSYRSDTQCRGVGALNAMTGQVTYGQRSHITATVLTDLYRQITQQYPNAEVIYVAQDNWPVHVYPTLVAALQPQLSPFWPPLPDNWPTYSQSKGRLDGLPIQLVFLPTYAPWLNPIEKLWRWLRQEVLHLHRLSDDWLRLKQRVLDFMSQFALGSQPLLHYVGLLPY